MEEELAQTYVYNMINNKVKVCCLKYDQEGSRKSLVIPFKLDLSGLNIILLC